MSTLIRFGPANVAYDTLKHSLVVDEERDGASNATFTTRGTGPSFAETVTIACNTISSLTFGGTVRSKRIKLWKSTATPRYEYEADDWVPLFEAKLPVIGYSSIYPSSIVMDLVAKFAPAFSNSAVREFYGGVPVTRIYDGTDTLKAIIDSLAAHDSRSLSALNPIHWYVDKQKAVHYGYANSLGTTVALGDADTDLIDFEMELAVSSLVTRVLCWGGSTTSQNIQDVPSFNVTVSANASGWWDEIAITGATGHYLGHIKVDSTSSELVPLTSMSVNSPRFLWCSTLNTQGVANKGFFPGDVIRLVYRVESTTLANQYGSLGCADGVFEAKVDDLGYQTSGAVPEAASDILRANGTAVSYLRLRTHNSLVAASGWLAVSLTVSSPYQGRYPIQRVRVVGFERGDQARPIYEVEAGANRETRITDIL